MIPLNAVIGIFGPPMWHPGILARQLVLVRDQQQTLLYGNTLIQDVQSACAQQMHRAAATGAKVPPKPCFRQARTHSRLHPTMRRQRKCLRTVLEIQGSLRAVDVRDMQRPLIRFLVVLGPRSAKREVTAAHWVSREVTVRARFPGVIQCGGNRQCRGRTDFSISKQRRREATRDVSNAWRVRDCRHKETHQS